MVKEVDIESRKHGVPNKMNPKRPAPRHAIIIMPKVKDKDRILKATRKKVSYLQGCSHRLSADFSKELCRLDGTGKKYSK